MGKLNVDKTQVTNHTKKIRQIANGDLVGTCQSAYENVLTKISKGEGDFKDEMELLLEKESELLKSEISFANKMADYLDSVADDIIKVDQGIKIGLK